MVVAGFTVGSVRRRLKGLIERAISRMCSGVVPQHPPTHEAPKFTNRLAYSVKYSGEQK
jgi:hypothetical protein